MNDMEHYLEEIERRVFGTRESLKRLESDLRARFEQGVASGESTATVIDRLGTPDEVAAAFMADVELEYAGFWRRVFAFLVDVALCLLLVLPFAALAAVLGPGLEGLGSAMARGLAFATIVGVGLTTAGLLLFYFPLLESHYGKTPGKHLMKLQVRTERGARIGLGTAFLRRLSFYFDILVIDALFIPFTEKRQRAFDIVAKTVVVRDPVR